MQVNHIHRQVPPHKYCVLPNTQETKSFVTIINLDNIKIMLQLAGYRRWRDWETRVHVSANQMWSPECPGQVRQWTVTWDGTCLLA